MVRMRTAGTAAALVVAGAWLSGCVGSWNEARFKDTRELTLPAQPYAGLDVESSNGRIAVTAVETEDILVVATIRAISQERLDATTVYAAHEPPGVLNVGVLWPDGQRESNEGCSFEISGPAFDGVRLVSSNGSITARGQFGPGHYTTSNGRVTVEDQAGPVKVWTSNGRITLDGVEQQADAHSSNGPVSVQLAEGSTGPVNVATSNGSVRIVVPQSLRGEIVASTSNGSIQVHQPDALNRSRLIGRGKNRLSVPAHEEGATSTIVTSNGSVQIEIAPEG